MNDFTVLIIGLPEAGKTTFLAAFWHAINEQSGFSLRLADLQPLRDYLNRIRDSWLKCELLGRTTLASEHVVQISVEAIDLSNSRVEVVFPDHAGEKFLQQWSHRQWDAGFSRLVEQADGILLFINPQTHKLAPTIASALPLVSAIEPDLTSESAEETEKKWDPANSSDDVQIVDLLQSVLWQRNVETLPVVVAISAWDVVKNTGLTPKKWLEINSPLLSQFLESTVGSNFHAVFGVSGQGGSLAESGRLLAVTDPMDRIEVVSENGSSHDVTLPVSWLLRKKRAT